jgi:hypothetical protein
MMKDCPIKFVLHIDQILPAVTAEARRLDAVRNGAFLQTLTVLHAFGLFLPNRLATPQIQLLQPTGTETGPADFDRLERYSGEQNSRVFGKL